MSDSILWSRSFIAVVVLLLLLFCCCCCCCYYCLVFVFLCTCYSCLKEWKRWNRFFLWNTNGHGENWSYDGLSFTFTTNMRVAFLVLVVIFLFSKYIKGNKSRYVAKSRQRYYKTLINFFVARAKSCFKKCVHA